MEHRPETTVADVHTFAELALEQLDGALVGLREPKLAALAALLGGYSLCLYGWTGGGKTSLANAVCALIDLDEADLLRVPVHATSVDLVGNESAKTLVSSEGVGEGPLHFASGMLASKPTGILADQVGLLDRTSFESLVAAVGLDSHGRLPGRRSSPSQPVRFWISTLTTNDLPVVRMGEIIGAHGLSVLLRNETDLAKRRDLIAELADFSPQSVVPVTSMNELELLADAVEEVSLPGSLTSNNPYTVFRLERGGVSVPPDVCGHVTKLVAALDGRVEASIDDLEQALVWLRPMSDHF